jgi:hypothetical protein
MAMSIFFRPSLTPRQSIGRGLPQHSRTHEAKGLPGRSRAALARNSSLPAGVVCAPTQHVRACPAGRASRPRPRFSSPLIAFLLMV